MRVGSPSFWTVVLLTIILLVLVVRGDSGGNRTSRVAPGVRLEGYPVGDRDLDEMRELVRRLSREAEKAPTRAQVIAESHLVPSRSGIRPNRLETARRLALAPAGADLRIPFEILAPDSPTDGPPLPIRRAAPGLAAVGLMINVAWGEQHLDHLLGVMRDRATATFFVLGTWAEKHPEEVERLLAGGHEIAVHGHRDRRPSHMSRDELREDLDQCARLLASASGFAPTLYTPHYAESSPTIVAAARDVGLCTLLPSADTADWLLGSPEAMLERVLPHTRDGALVLMHPTPETPEFLRRYLDHLDERGLRAMGCEALLRRPPPPPGGLARTLQRLDRQEKKMGGE